MSFEHRTRNGVDIVILRDRLDAAAAPGVRDDLRALIAAGSARLVLNMSGVARIDSSGLSVLVTALKAARAAGGDVVLVGPTAAVRSLLELTRLHRVVLIFDDEDSAVGALAA